MGAPIVEQGGVAPHQGDGQPLEEPVRGGGLLLSLFSLIFVTAAENWLTVASSGKVNRRVSVDNWGANFSRSSK